MQTFNSCYKLYTKLVLISTLLILTQCTENPFDRNDNSDILDRHVLQGTLALSDSAGKNDIFIWLAGAGISTISDSHGSFRLQLPNTAEVQGLNGLFSLYYYLGNYGIDSSHVFIRAGLFEYGTNDLGADGKIMNAPVLKKLLDIHTTVPLAEIASSDSLTLFATVELKASWRPVPAGTLKNREGFLTALIFIKKNAALAESMIMLLPHNVPTTEVINVGKKAIWQGYFFIPAYYFAVGEYEVVPYLQIRQDNLPEELLLCFGEDVHELSYDYLNIPFKQTAAILKVTSQ